MFRPMLLQFGVDTIPFDATRFKLGSNGFHFGIHPVSVQLEKAGRQRGVGVCTDQKLLGQHLSPFA
jgi:hypothetical protein